jgi:hypothetical protein
MNASALLMMTVTFLIVTAVAVYFFWKVIRTSPKSGQKEEK